VIDAIRSFFQKNMAPPEEAEPAKAQHTVEVAACALLLELAHADDEFTDDERTHLEEALQRHFNLETEEADALMALAEQERRQSVDLYQFTSLIKANYDEGQQMVLAEVMWRMVYADGELAKHESYLMRKISGLLELRPGYLAEARNRAIQEDG
jgi:uncharacterized tellurite resistance protein B-like protein